MYHWWLAFIVTAGLLFVFAVSVHAFVFWKALGGSLFSPSEGFIAETTGGLNRTKLHAVLQEFDLLSAEQKNLLIAPPSIGSLGNLPKN